MQSWRPEFDPGTHEKLGLVVCAFILALDGSLGFTGQFAQLSEFLAKGRLCLKK